MAKLLSQTLAADGSTNAIVWKGSGKGTVIFYGTFGSGTITGHVSSDSGTTYVPLKDTTLTAISTNAAAMFNFEINGNEAPKASDIRVRFTLASSTSPSLTVDVFDNR